jgi:hypothetical protein
MLKSPNRPGVGIHSPVKPKLYMEKHGNQKQFLDVDPDDLYVSRLVKSKNINLACLFLDVKY